MSSKNLEQEARRFLENRSKENDSETLRKELIVLLEKFLHQLKNKGA